MIFGSFEFLLGSALFTNRFCGWITNGKWLYSRQLWETKFSQPISNNDNSNNPPSKRIMEVFQQFKYLQNIITISQCDAMLTLPFGTLRSAYNNTNEWMVKGSVNCGYDMHAANCLRIHKKNKQNYSLQANVTNKCLVCWFWSVLYALLIAHRKSVRFQFLNANKWKHESEMPN